jgi:general secretion pathway protein A
MLTRTLHAAYPESAQIAVVVHPYGGPQALLAAICRDFGFAVGLEHLQAGLLAAAEAGKRSLLVIDEAQGLGNECLEFVRQLTNLETTKRKLLQIVLLGQPELGARLARPALRQLEQRLQLKVALPAFGREDTFSYIRHRLECAGGSHFVRFDPEAADWIWKRSRGAPRMINKICEVALRFAERQRRRQVTADFLATLPLAQVGVRKPGIIDFLRNLG